MELVVPRSADDAGWVREAARRLAATTFSIMAVFIPVAFMGGMPGEWFRPFALTVTCSVAVSLFISFTLDPMLSAYWGDPPDHHTAQKKGIGKVLDKFNHWFDHQADRYGKVIAWALHHRRWMAVIAVASFVGARPDGLQGLRVPRLQIIQRETGLPYVVAADIENRLDALAGLDPPRARFERPVENRRGRAFRGAEIGVA